METKISRTKNYCKKLLSLFQLPPKKKTPFVIILILIETKRELIYTFSKSFVVLFFGVKKFNLEK